MMPELKNPMQADYAVVDLETTGLDPQKCKIIDVGIVYVKDDEPIGTYSQLVNPCETLTHDIIALTGITDEMLQGQPVIADIIQEVRKGLGDLPILGHHIKFDVDFLNSALEDAGLPLIASKTIDTMELSKSLYRNVAHHSLQDVMRRVGIDKTEEHRALADALDTLACYKKLAAMERPIYVDDEDAAVAAKQRQEKASKLLRAKYMGQNAKVRNEKPYGVVIPSAGGVEIIGEENHQDKLSEYGAGAWFWVELKRGANPVGSHAGEPTIFTYLDGEQIGWMTPTNTSRHYHQVPPEGCVALAHTKSGKQAALQLEVRVEMPKAEPASEEYKMALAEARPIAQPKAPATTAKAVGGKTDDIETCMSIWGTANKMPHKKDITGNNRTPIILTEESSAAIDQYADGTLLWVRFRKNVTDGTPVVQVSLGHNQIGTLDLQGNATCIDLITDNGAMAKIEIGTQGNSRTATALIR